MKYMRVFVLVIIFIISMSCMKTPIKTCLSFGSSEEKWVNKVIKNMTLREKIAQMVACRYNGDFFNSKSDYFRDLIQLAREEKVGGFILFGGNAYETAILTNTLQAEAKIPLLIATDLERGLGNQVDGAVLFPPIMSIGATGSEDLAYQMGKITAVEARAIGIHMTYAPVVDVNVNPDNPIINVRSFGEDPDMVSRLGVAFIKGCQDHGLLATAKHFPGHGDTDLDSHSVLPVITGDRARLDAVELYPFKQAVDAGVKAIMTAHLRIPALDPTPDMPATLSQPILTGLLRKEMGFQGLIVTDAMNMGGITTIFSPEEAAIKAILAGVDMVLIPPEPRNIIKNLVSAVESGKISQKRIDTSVHRILKAKASLGLFRKSQVSIESLNDIIADKKNETFAQEVFARSMTLVKNAGEVIPLKNNDKKIAVFSLSSDPGGYYAGRDFVQEIRSRCSETFEFYADAFTGKEYLAEAMAASQDAETVLIALFSRLRAWKGSVGLNKDHIQLIRGLAERDIPVVVISFGSPYFLKEFPGIDVYMCAYRHAPQAQIAAAQALFAEIDVKGKLPVSIPGLYKRGDGVDIVRKQNK